jgi:methyl-accepting chemotaxis protein
MFLEGIIEVAIGIIFVFLVFSFAVMQLVELYATLGKVREKQLADSIQRLLGSEKAQKAIYSHPLIKSYTKWERRLPAYITTESFADAITEMISTAGTPESSIKKSLEQLSDVDKNLDKLIELGADELGETIAEAKEVKDLIKNLAPIKDIVTKITQDIDKITPVVEAKVQAIGDGLAKIKNLTPALDDECDQINEYLNLVMDGMQQFSTQDLKDLPAYQKIITDYPYLATLLDPKADIQEDELISQLLQGALSFSGAKSDLYEVVNAYVEQVKQTGAKFDKSLTELKKEIRTWFDNSQKRATDWYKRHTRLVTFIIGMILAIAFNVDALNITNTLWTQPTLRKAFVATIESTDLTKYQPTTAESSETEFDVDEFLETQEKIIDSLDKSLSSFNLPVGWKKTEYGEAYKDFEEEERTTGWKLTDTLLCNARNCLVPMGQNSITGWFGTPSPDAEDGQNGIPAHPGILIKFAGWILTAIASIQGAPFWFDLLNKIMDIRGTGSKPAEDKPKDKNGDGEGNE